MVLLVIIVAAINQFVLVVVIIGLVVVIFIDVRWTVVFLFIFYIFTVDDSFFSRDDAFSYF